MNLLRNEIRTGLLVVFSLILLVGVLLYLGAPGVFIPQHTFRVYFDNAGGVKSGSDVLLAGRKVGQITVISSPIPESERPEQKFEALIEVRVDARSRIYSNAKVQMVQTSLLGDSVLDFNSGRESAGLAPNGAYFRGERVPGLNDAVPKVLEALDPAIKKLTDTLDTLQGTARNFNRITEEGGELPMALSEFRQFGVHLNELSGPESSLSKSLANIESLTGPEGRINRSFEYIEGLTGPQSSLSRTFKNAEQFTGQLANNKDVGASLRNFRSASAQLNRTVSDLSPELGNIAHNLTQASDTVKHQPWRLIWPSTKKYPEDRLQATPTPTPKPTPAPTPTPRPKVSRAKGPPSDGKTVRR